MLIYYHSKQYISCFFAMPAPCRNTLLRTVLPFVLCLLMPVSTAAEEKKEPEVHGPVPRFTHQTRKDVRAERIYIRLSYPEFSIPFLDRLVQEQLQDFTDGKDPRLWLDSLLDGLKEDLDQDETPWLMERSFGYSLYAPGKDTLSILFDSWSLEQGMIHGLYAVWGYTVDLRTGRLLTLGDIFPDWKASAPELSRLLGLCLAEMGADPDEAYLDTRLRDVNPGDSSFLLTPDGLTVVIRGLPIPMWSLSCLDADKEDLQRAGLDTRWWEEE